MPEAQHGSEEQSTTGYFRQLAEEQRQADQQRQVAEATQVHTTVVEAPVDQGQPEVSRLRDPRRRGPLTALIAAGAVVAAFAAGSYLADDEDERATTVAELAEADEACATSWAVVQTNNEQSRLIAEGLPSLGAATTDTEAREAANEWFGLVKHDPELLAATTNAVTGSAYIAEQMHDGTCFTSTGEQAAAELEIVLASSVITPEDPSANGLNSGTDANGNLVVASGAGISGNTAGITMILDDGTKLGILERCGNLVFEVTPPNIPEGPTDEPTPTTTPTTRPTTTETTIPPKEDDGVLPGNPDVPADQDPGTPDVPGEGPAGQTPDEDGYVDGETRPSVPATTTTTHPQTTPTTERPPATTGSTTPTTNPPSPATTSTPTTAPQSGTLPPRP